MMTLPGMVERLGSATGSYIVDIDNILPAPQPHFSGKPAWVGMSPQSPSREGTSSSTASTTLPEDDIEADRLKDFQYEDIREQLASEEIKVLCEAAARLEKYQPTNLRQRRKMGHLSVDMSLCREKDSSLHDLQKIQQKPTKAMGLGERLNAKMSVWEQKVQSMFKKLAIRGPSRQALSL